MATFVLADGTYLNISNAHLYVGGTANVLATRKITGKATLDLDAKGLRMGIDGELIPFDGGYCAFKVRPLTAITTTYSVPLTPITVENLEEIFGRHPEALSAILITGVHPRHFGGEVTGNERSPTGLREMTAEDLRQRFKERTALGSRQLKELPIATYPNFQSRH